MYSPVVKCPSKESAPASQVLGSQLLQPFTTLLCDVTENERLTTKELPRTSLPVAKCPTDGVSNGQTRGFIVNVSAG
jgi:hypothetical protein